jgi:Protein of unknown function (DUF3309)
MRLSVSACNQWGEVRHGRINGTLLSLSNLKAGKQTWSNVMLSTILIILLVLLLIGALPAWPYSTSWGYVPGRLLGTILVVVVILALLGHI